MSYDTAEEKQLCQYLLGKLAEDEQRQMEEQLMTRDDLFQQLQVLEDELIDGYLRETLSEEDREAFEKHFLSSPERHQKVEFAQAFRSYVAVANEAAEKVPSKSSPWQTFWAALRIPAPVLRYGFPVVLVAVLLGGLRMGSTIQRLNTQVAQIRTEQGSWHEKEQQLQQQLEEQRRSSQKLEQQLARAQTEQRPSIENPLSSMVAFALTPGGVRDSGTFNRVTIPSGTRLVGLKLELGDNRYQDYRAVLESNGSEILVVNKLKPERIGTKQVIVLPLPANILPHDDYSLKLSGVSSAGEFDPLGNYSFRVVRRQVD
jgi:anti-sigma factor RsiW